jgi:hypothetical protein
MDLADLVIHATSKTLDINRLEYSVYSPNRILVAELYRLLSAAAPDFVILTVDEGGFEILTIDPRGFDEDTLKLVFSRSIDKVNHLILEPDFKILDATILGLICLIVASRSRILKYV